MSLFSDKASYYIAFNILFYNKVVIALQQNVQLVTAFLQMVGS